MRIQDPKNVHMNPDAGVNTKEEKVHQQVFNLIIKNDIKKS